MQDAKQKVRELAEQLEAFDKDSSGKQLQVKVKQERVDKLKTQYDNARDEEAECREQWNVADKELDKALKKAKAGAGAGEETEEDV